MTEVTRRGFVVQASVAGAAAAAGAAAMPLLDAGGTRPAGVLPETLVLHVRDLATSEVAILADTEEVVYRDEKLVTSLLQAFARATTGTAKGTGE
jgi:hypothetical protein